MNDLDRITATLAKPEASERSFAAGRARLEREIHRSRRPRLVLWTAGAVGLGAVAAAALVAAASIGATKAADLSARPVLMAAASTAETTPPVTGRYWYTDTGWAVKGTVSGKKMRPRSGTTRIWVDRADHAWIAQDGGKPVESKGWTFNLCDKSVRFADIQALPTDPAALRAKMTDAMKNNDDGPVPAADQDRFVTGCMADLLYSLPAPAKVRAAAFRSLAAMPESRDLGTRKDGLGRSGKGLLIDNGAVKTTLIIDPRTSTVLEHVLVASGIKSVEQRYTVRTAAWTDRLG
ncbi:CU044_5270 family protein [Actinocorallia longicatena]|uniref:CU044_5270 family protein n=1 Tax=Actinocorallia longicatena TaxID=111803 RepID=A0ABP6QK04_9ACTN